MPQPWANLSAKFQDIIDLLTAQNAKLDALTDALLAPGVVPRVPYLQQIRNSLVAQDGDPTDIRAAIWGLAGPAPGRTLTDLFNLFAPTEGDLRPYGLLSNIALETLLARQILADYKDTFGDRGGGMTFYNMIDTTNINLAGVLQALGEPTGDATTTVLGRLIAIANATACACSALNPQPPSSGCDGTAYNSSGTVVDEYGATGPMSIATFTSAGALQISEDGQTIATGTSSWEGWRVYVTSTASQFAYRAGVTNRLPTKTWIDLSSYADEMSFAVEAGTSIQVTLCGPAEQPCAITQCFASGGTGTRFYWVAGSYPSDPPWNAGQWIFGKGFRILSGSGVRWGGRFTGFDYTYHLLSLNKWYHADTFQAIVAWAIYSETSDFEIEICPTVQPGSKVLQYSDT